MKFISLDIETTGLEPSVNSILEMSFVYWDSESPHEEVEKLPSLTITFDVKNSDLVYSLPAIVMNRELLKKIHNDDIDYQNLVDPSDEHHAYIMVRKFFSGCGYDIDYGDLPIIIGKNVSSFDIPFIKLQYPSIAKLFQRRTVDPSILFVRSNDESIPSLSECLERASIYKEVAHTSLEDAQDVIRVMRYGFELINQSPKS